MVGRIRGYDAPDEHGLRRLQVEADLSSVPPGLYRLETRLTVGDETLVTHPLSLVLLPVSDAPRVAWSGVTATMLSGRRLSTPTVEVAREAPSRDRRRRARQLEDGAVIQAYDEILATLAGGDLRGARERLFNLSVEQFDKGLAGLDALRNVELDAAVRIAGIEPAGSGDYGS